MVPVQRKFEEDQFPALTCPCVRKKKPYTGLVRINCLSVRQTPASPITAKNVAIAPVMAVAALDERFPGSMKRALPGGRLAPTDRIAHDFSVRAAANFSDLKLVCNRHLARGRCHRRCGQVVDTCTKNLQKNEDRVKFQEMMQKSSAKPRISERSACKNAQGAARKTACGT